MAAYITIKFNTGLQGDSQWTAPPYWTANTSYTAEWGEGVKPTTANGHNYLCTTAGTSGSADPFDNGQTDKNWDEISDGTVVWTCFDEFTNPTLITGTPFGHGWKGSIWYMYYLCRDPLPTDYIDSTYLSGSTYDVNTLSSQHEVPTVRYRTYGEGDLIVGNDYTWKEIWKDADGNIIFEYDYTESYPDVTAVQTGCNIGWSPCWWWSWGSWYDGNPEITEGSDTGTNYSLTIEVWDGSTLKCTKTETFTVKNLHHTEIYWNHIQDYTGADIGGYFGMKASEYVHDLGSDVWDTQWYRKKNLSSAGTLKVDGMEGTVDLQAYRSGYVKQVRSCDSVTDKDTKGPYDFDGSNYLPASVEGHVIEGSNFVSNVNIWGERSGAKYGCKSNSNGLYALPLHTGGTYTIKAVKNNHDVITRGSTIAQTGDHPSSAVLWEFTLSRTTNYPQGEYAHLNSLAADNQSVIIPDDPVTGTGTPNQPDSVGATVVKVKTHKWGDGTAQCTTSTNGSNGGSAYGSGGFDYNGDMGEAESWSEEPPP